MTKSKEQLQWDLIVLKREIRYTRRVQDAYENIYRRSKDAMYVNHILVQLDVQIELKKERDDLEYRLAYGKD